MRMMKTRAVGWLLAVSMVQGVLSGGVPSARDVLGRGVPSAEAAQVGRVGIRAGAGTDISGGFAFGVGANYLIQFGNFALEPGLLFFKGSFSETTVGDVHTYEEKTDVTVFGALANLLFNYQADVGGTFFVLGAGLASVSVEWEESSATDTSLGPPLAGGGSKQQADGAGAGSVFNLGVGYNFGGSPLDLRFEVPIILTFAPPGKASSVVPTFILTAGVRF